MALSGSFSGSVKDEHYKIRVDWTATQSIPNNSSTITCKLYFINNWNIAIGARTHTINIGGTNYSLSSNTITTQGTHYIGQVAKTITHNTNGTSPSVSLSAVFDFRATIEGTYYSTINASGSATFNTIPRNSTITLNTNTQFIGSNITIYTNRASSSFTHKITYAFGNLSGVVATGVGDSYTWTLPSTFYSQIPNAKLGVGALYLATYLGSTKIGDTTQILYYPKCVESSCKPTLSFDSLSESIEGLSDDFNLNGTTQFVNTLSRITANYSSVSCKNSATFSKVNLIIGGASIGTTSSSATSLSLGSGVNFNSGNLTAKLTITDSRGYTNSYSKSIKVYNYAKPTVNSSVSRLNNYENETTIIPKGTIQVINSEYKELTFKYRVYEKETTAPSYTNISAPTVSTTGVVSAPSIVENLDNTKEYVVDFYMYDGYNAQTETYLINRGVPLLFINSESGDLDVSGHIYLNNNKRFMTKDNEGNPKTIAYITEDNIGCIGLGANLEEWRIGSATSPLALRGTNITANGAKVYSKKLLWQGKILGGGSVPNLDLSPYSEVIVKYVGYGVTGYTHIDLTKPLSFTPLTSTSFAGYPYIGSSVALRTEPGRHEFHYIFILINTAKTTILNKEMGYFLGDNGTVNVRNGNNGYYIDTVWGVY